MKSVLMLLSLLFLAACVHTPTHFELDVDALVQYQPKPGSKIYLENRSEDVGLEKLHYAKHVADAFTANGFIIVDDARKCDYQVNFVHSMKSSSYQRSRPVFNYQPAQSYTMNTYTPNGAYTSQITQNGGGTMQVVGSRTDTFTDYIHSLVLISYDISKFTQDMKQDATGAIAFQMAITDVNSVDDHKLFFPIMADVVAKRVGHVVAGKSKETIIIPPEGYESKQAQESIENRTPATTP